MRVDEPGVFIPDRWANAVLVLASAEVQRRRERGHDVTPEVRRILGELAGRAEAHARGCSESCSDRRSDVFRGPIVDGVNTSTAAERLRITQRAVISRLHRGSLRGEQDESGTWVVELPEESA